MANYVLISHKQVKEKFPQFKHTARVPGGYHVLPMSALRFLSDAEVIIKNEAQIRAMKSSVNNKTSKGQTSNNQ